MRLLIVDDHILFREGVVSLLEMQPDLNVVGQAASVHEAIAMTADLQPDLILMDFGLPDGTGLEATKAILARFPKINIVFLTVHESDERLFDAIRMGAKGYLLKNVHSKSLIAYLRGVERGEAALEASMTAKILNEFVRLPPPNHSSSSMLDCLSVRELEVLQELESRATNREIADRLAISENTVKNHVSSILTKLNLKSRREVTSIYNSA